MGMEIGCKEGWESGTIIAMGSLTSGKLTPLNRRGLTTPYTENAYLSFAQWRWENPPCSLIVVFRLIVLVKYVLGYCYRLKCWCV
ncbi:hypothetical protein FH972_016727 [Carpinus fangiana]|uniref:Uncharacterized protein n=1 Tax=Carpinus fangiana TaxID=176857 RepID=A0A5N6RI16_9ROSI|nr:hypothetical protein FH972_016727 [Carpinus fangiana]